jgi:hypothetical protein
MSFLQKLGSHTQAHRQQDALTIILTEFRGGYTDRLTDTNGYTDSKVIS